MKYVYLFLAIIGAIFPYIFFAQYMLEHGVALSGFVGQLFATAPASGFTADLLITSLAFWIWSFGQAKKHQIRHWWLFVVLNLTVGLSCALPLFLFFREIKLESAKKQAENYRQPANVSLGSA